MDVNKGDVIITENYLLNVENDLSAEATLIGKHAIIERRLFIFG